MTPTSPVRAAIYARQSVAEPDGIEVQVSRCQSLAAARDYDVVEVYRDDATSGYRERGTGTAFDRMLEDAKAGRFDVLVVRKVDRLGRSLAALERLTTLRVHIITVDGELDLSTTNGRLMANLVTSVARAESETKAERRVNANKARREEDGIPTSGRVPYGYRWVTKAERDKRAQRGEANAGHAYELDGERADDVRRLYADFLAGVPLRSIAAEWNEAKKRTLPVVGSDPSNPRLPDGAPFRPTTLRRMLMSPYYAALLPLEAPKPGERYDQAAITRETCRAGAWPALVTVEQWEAAKARLANPERTTSPGPARKWLLSGIAVCGGHGRRDDAAIAKVALALDQASEADAAALTPDERAAVVAAVAALAPEARAAAAATLDPQRRTVVAAVAALTPQQLDAALAGLDPQERAAAALALAGERCGEPIRAGGGARKIHSYRCRSMAHFMRQGEPLDRFVEARVVQYIAARGADLLVNRERPDVDKLRLERERLAANVRQAGDDEQDGLIDRAERVRLTKRARARIDELDAKLRAGLDDDGALSGVVAAEDVAEAWRGLSLTRRRAALEALVDVVVHSVGQGNRRSMSDAALDRTVSIRFRR
ncbi:recombinase family protein [Agrococcus beijingensis]|uniref:recombinase family protein n=1 Tax=Agrococcus beijingensis TaxID=3068634 RepID=UPI0027415EDD|nr:recombinase family protein [Agrococcus sp. REN33]